MAVAPAVRQFSWTAAIALVFATGGWVARSEVQASNLAASLDLKADTIMVHDLRQEVLMELRALTAAQAELSIRFDSLAHRQQQFFCADRPAFCR